MSFQSSTAFNMGAALNKLRAIENGAIQEKHAEPGMEDAGAAITDANFTRLMGRLNAIKDAVTSDHFNALRAGVRSLHMGRRPNLEQMSALMDLLETMLSYVADDQTLFQRLKYDLKQDTSDEGTSDDEAEEVVDMDDTDREEEEKEEEEDDIVAASSRDLKA